MQAYKCKARIPDNHRLEITLPENFPEGEAEVIVLMKTETTPAPGMSLREFTAWLEQQPPGPHSEEEIEAWIREERSDWGED
ncbi:MAG: hypothetical protein LBO00_04525 [Zoogloeaceae bacterium]|jgi:hypothetical protein|nr:hypothetical protein [Zoogloeaceae bacterium]